MKPALRRPMTRSTNKLKRFVQNQSDSGVVDLNDSDDEARNIVMESLEGSGDGVDAVVGSGGTNAGGSGGVGADAGEETGVDGSDDEEGINDVYVSDNEDILLYESYSDEEVRKIGRANPKYNDKVSGKEFEFELGMEFNTLKQFKDTIKTYVKEHKCRRTLDNKQANSSWLALRLVDKIRGEPKVSAVNLAVYVNENLSLDISRTHAYRAKKKALEIIDGNHQEQYGKLRSYLAEVVRTNIGSTCNIIVDRNNPEDPAIFKRAYMCLAPLRDGFLVGCRPLIGLDGCFLKTSYGGQLLTAISQDGANGIFPIAWAVVERENADSWIWFLRNLLQDIGGFNVERWCFISDRQKGLVWAIETLSTEAQQVREHRFYVRHIYANFSKKWPGAHFRKLVFDCAKATTTQIFHAKMQKIKELDVEAWQYLANIQPNLWTKVGFSSYSKNDSIVNNASESFNSKLL
ncbi:uncharacterized protein LOC120007349 [Tripterygium wilfordii]|uniref:uncharacterized protein LOC120007349 n=1 Tax=Tripterygium wilfordii TaxID=458696 RepID=UPI0018F83B0A|nr:uncharacterized protein LOC120007349 [Tripterygium wilfordii]